MDRPTLRVRLEARSKDAIERALDAMEAAPMDNIVGGSEMEIREICIGLQREIFQELVQAKVQDAEAAAKPSLSPSAGPCRSGAAGAVEGQGRSGPLSAHRQR